MSYLQVADHPEYPSATSSFCAAQAQASRLFFESDRLGWSVNVKSGSSRIEQGITPSSDLTFSWATWSDFQEDCGNSRLWGGVHFKSAIVVSQDLGESVGDVAYDFVKAHIDGKVGRLK